VQNNAPVDFTYADPTHNRASRRWWVLTRRVEPYNCGLAASPPYPDHLAAWQDLTQRFGAPKGPWPFDVAFLTEGEVRRWTRDVQAGLTPEVEARWERYLTHTHVHSPPDRFPVAVVEVTVSPMVSSDRCSHRLVYEEANLAAVLEQTHEELGDDPDDPWGESVTCEVVWLAPEGVEVGSDEHQARYRDWLCR